MPVKHVAITLRADSPLMRVAEPVTCGVPFPRGAIRDPVCLRLMDAAGAATTLQVRVLEKWPDGSAKWVLCDWFATGTNGMIYRLNCTESAVAETFLNVAGGRVNETDVQNRVRQLRSGPAFSTDTVQVSTADKSDYRLLPDFDWDIEADGQVRLCVAECGSIVDEGGDHLLRYRVRTHYFARSPVVRVHLTVTNPRAATHPDGLWDLGDPNSILVKDLAIVIPLAGAGPFSGHVSYACTAPFDQFATELAIYQDSSGGENWRSSNHVDSRGHVPNRLPGFRLRLDQYEQDGQRASPIVHLRRGDDSIAVAVPEFWQNFPKAIEADAAGITLRLFPQQSAALHEIQPGEQKTHIFFIARGADAIMANPLEWTRAPLVPVVDPEWVAATGAIPAFTAQAQDPHRDYQQLVDAAIAGDDTLLKKREVIDEYGWRHFGDIYGDHEAVLHPEYGRQPRISHYNNQYDAVAGFAIHWLRSGDVRWYRHLNELASHVRDIDIYNTDADKSAYNRGLFWHTYHYVDADTGTHRAYPKSGRIPPHGNPVPGGGPGNEQNYPHGLLLHYLLTGDEASKEAAIGLAQWVIDMDDGRLTIFGWLSRAATGLASASRTPDYHGPGRGSANSIAALVDGHRLSGEDKFLRKAEELIRRVIHPADDVAQMVGMIRAGKVYIDAENRWFYVMFLHALAKYLDYKCERAELDEHYAYARACLLHYTRWMAQHEYPYLDHPALLEYPTETWAAQDMWKSEVFDSACLHADDTERAFFRERAEYFFRRSIGDLSQLPTRTLCRPVVLMLGHGWRRAWFAAHPDERRPAPRWAGADFAPRERFVPQKVIALRRARVLGLVVALTILILLVVLLVWLVK